MKNYDPVSYAREKWSDSKHTKNKPASCSKAHSFCNFEYQWARESDKSKADINLPVNPVPYFNYSSQTLPGVNLPPPKQRVISVNYETMTEQNLDDWIAQSMNRSLKSILNPQKKFFVPIPLEQQLRYRYRKHKETKKGSNNDETYFDTQSNRKKQKSYLLNERKKRMAVDQLCFDFHKLEPRVDMGGMPIKLRQMKKVKKKEIVRRNAVFLINDVHYARFLKQREKQSKEKVPTQEKVEHKQIVPSKNMIYSFNLESMNRKSCYDDVPNSIIEKQYSRIKGPSQDFLSSHRALMNKQEELHEKYRMLMNQKTQNTINTIKEMSNTNQADYSIEAKTAPPKKKIQAAKQSLSNNLTSNMTVNTSKNNSASLEQKIMKLLNNMQVQSETVSQLMASLNIHPEEILLEHPDSRPQIKWILKAEEKLKSKQHQLAIDCYKQAIIIQPQLFIAVFNIGVLLEKQKMLESSKKWFEVAKQFETDSERVGFGLAIVKLKQLRYDEALADINELINKIDNSNKNVPFVYRYIRALCNKQLLKYSEAKKDYKFLESNIKPSNYHVIPDFIFSIVYSKTRRVPLSFNCLSYMLFKQATYLILYEDKKKIKDQQAKLENIAQKLIKKPFFKRFSLKLVKKLLDQAVYEEKTKDQIIFSQKDKASIIINGLVSLRSHEKDIVRPIMVSVLGEGGVIGAGQLDNQISQKPNNWFSALSSVELITIPVRDFQMFWKGQFTFEVDFKFNFLRNIQLFRGLSEYTLLKLCQLFKEVQFEKGTILFNDCSYRNTLISNPGKGYGLSKLTQKTDPRFIQAHNFNRQITSSKKNKGRSKIHALIKKHIFKFNQMKFSRLKYPGLYIIKSGSVELEDDKGFRCSNIITSMEFFGENLILDVDGFHKYGRMVAESDVQAFVITIQDLMWAFNQQDKTIMKKNCQKRQAVQTVAFLRNRFSQCLVSKFQCKRNKW